MINPQLAWSIREERGLLLPTHQDYTHPRLKEIAILQKYLYEQLDSLDYEIKQIRDEHIKENGESF